MSEPAKKPKEAPLPKKDVSAKAMGRLGHARGAIEATKRVLSFGAGNQVEALTATKMNSEFRLDAMRKASYWTLAPELEKLARENPDALTAAKADLVHGGNCGEHGWIAYNYLREHANGEQIERVTSDIDHGFVLIGDRSDEAASEIAVADPWPTRATACLWEDHFCYATNLETRKSMVADGKNFKGAIAAGLRLSEEGKKAAAKKATAAETKEAVDHAADHHYWNQPDTAAGGHKYDYTQKP